MEFAIVVSQFNKSITDKLLQGALSRLIELGIAEKMVKIVRVPGAIEIPLAAKLLAEAKKYQAIICLGAVIRGETDHYDYVCQQVILGCSQVMLEYNTPIIFGILTTKNMKQAKERVGGKEGHKGIDAANAALTMAEVVTDLKSYTF